ncbi:hypothetical protein J3Q64DRAFT_1808142 [Phycomyces blakesleeanus]|uniref:CCZ1/INTU/HSP4 first Longin domain-containing protein n=1 Tax=Phycomyces blakesleeanus TaxID=4837 RepID=A0ABR3BA15_PHYBL
MTTQSLHEESQSANKDDGLHAPMLGKTSPMLSYFCVYNPSLGPTEENTKDQILYYTAKRVVPADVKMKQVGLAQALVKFTSAFSPSKPTQNVHTQKNRMIFLQPEPGFWMYMCVELGILRRQIRDAKGKEKLVTEYLDTQLSDRALESVLKIGYEQFKLLHGTFSYILYQDDEDISGLPSRQRTRSLMHCIEEFFSEWIWKWDFDRLDTMVFSAVFNGVPVQPILRTNYLKVHELDRALHERFNQSIDHVLVFDSDEGGLLYRSPSLNIRDVCALRKYVFKRIEKSIAREKEISGLKFFTKSISQSHFLGFFTSSLSTKTTAPVTSAPVSAVGSQTSLPDLLDTAEAAPEIEADANPDTMDINPKNVDMNGDERTVTRIEMAQVYLSSRSALDTSPDKPHNSTYGHSKDDEDEILTEYYLVIYKHKANIVWSFLLPSFSQEAEDLLADQKFYSMLEKYMVEEQNLNGITEAIVSNVRSAQEKR